MFRLLEAILRLNIKQYVRVCVFTHTHIYIHTHT